MLNKIFNGADALPAYAIIIRTIILYTSVIIATRIMGKRQVGIISGHNYLVAAGIVSLVAVRMVNPKTSLLSGIVIVFTYAGFNWLWSYLDLKVPNLIDRKPLVLMEDGFISAKNLSRAQLSIDEFLMELRSQQIWNLSVIQQATLEPTGDLTVLKRQEVGSATKKEMGIAVISYNSQLQVIYRNPKEFKDIRTSLPQNVQGCIINPDNTLTYIK